MPFSWFYQKCGHSGPGLGVTKHSWRIQLSEVDVPQVRTLLVVENKANCFASTRKHPSPGRVVVFHGGCFSPQRGRFSGSSAERQSPRYSCSTERNRLRRFSRWTIVCAGRASPLSPLTHGCGAAPGAPGAGRTFLRSIRGKTGASSASLLYTDTMNGKPCCLQPPSSRIIMEETIDS